MDSIVEMEKHIIQMLADNDYSAKEAITSCLSSTMFILSAEIDGQTTQRDRINVLVEQLLPIINNFVEFCSTVNNKVANNEPIFDKRNY